MVDIERYGKAMDLLRLVVEYLEDDGFSEIVVDDHWRLVRSPRIENPFVEIEE